MLQFTPRASALLVIGLAVLHLSCGTAPGKKVKSILLPQSGDTDAEPAAGDSIDYNSPSYGIHAPKGWYSLPIVLRFEEQVPEEIRTGTRKAARTWNDAVGFDLLVFDLEHEVASRSGDLYGRLNDDISSIGVDPNWRCTGRSSFVLGTAIWDNAADNQDFIVSGDVVFNTEFFVVGDAETQKADGYREVVDAESLALHELGHLIGLGHASGVKGPASVMAPTVYIGEGMTNRVLSEGDIQRVRNIYSRRGLPERASEALRPARKVLQGSGTWRPAPVPGCDNTPE